MNLMIINSYYILIILYIILIYLNVDIIVTRSLKCIDAYSYFKTNNILLVHQ